METVIEKIKLSLEKNGFPDKMVRLPFQPVFKSCKNHGTSLSTVLNELKSSDILHEIDADRILFYHSSRPPRKKEETTGPPPSQEHGIPEELYAEAMEKIKDMDPQEVERIREQVMNMSEEEREAMMRQAEQIFKNRKS